MDNKLIIEGGRSLRGEVRIQGAKNAAQKILPATVVFPGEYVIRNIPGIQDSADLIEILRFLRAEVEFLDDHTARVNTENVVPREIPPDVTAKSTGSFLFAGALLSRFGGVKIWHPGGDRIGRRRVTWHLDAFRRLGASVIEEQDYYEVHATSLTGSTIRFTRRTVNGTVNAILASVRADGVTILENVPLDPEIDNFIEFMQGAGARMGRVKDGQIQVEGVSSGTGKAEIDVIPDRNDAATFVIAGALGSGPVMLRGIYEEHLLPLLAALSTAGVRFETQSDGVRQSLTVQCDGFLPPGLHIISRPYPGFSTDWGPMTQVLMTQVPGISTFHETIFSQRFAHVEYLIKMGADIEYFNPEVDDSIYNFVRDPTAGLFHAVRIKGPTKLHGTVVDASDVRAGAALVLASLIADGTTEVTSVHQIDRGYEAFAERLKQLGASIERVRND